MVSIDPELVDQLEANPEEAVDLIVRTRGDVTPHLGWLTSAGLRVKQQFKLIPGVAVSCSGKDALQLLKQDWVLSVELDAPVTTM